MHCCGASSPRRKCPHPPKTLGFRAIHRLVRNLLYLPRPLAKTLAGKPPPTTVGSGRCDSYRCSPAIRTYIEPRSAEAFMHVRG
ncbi:hypothetical protein azo1174 [Azoarcus olearius]|uniref:Uncharacterized protein n=1 Tax=Azoarcus sp. (strain BH72) TaxID=418699 RepID=A1K4N6_AZOSB|nr:hypothetical protein azo1174 [Azoarcus olearius]